MITFRTLGGMDLLDAAGVPVQSVLAQPKRLALLASLAIPLPGTFLRRDTLVARLWPELDDARGRGALNTSVHFLRQALGRDVVVSRGQEELGLDPAQLCCDAADFEAAARRGDHAAAAGIYRGDLLDGFYADDAAEFERWVSDERARLKQLALNSARAARADATKQGDADAAIRWDLRVCELAPLDEGELQVLLTALRGTGRRSEGLAVYERFRDRLAQDLEEEPAAETKALAEALSGDAPHPDITAVISGAEGQRRRSRVRSALRAGTMAGVVGLAGFIVVRLALRPAAPRTEPDRIAVLPFQVHGDSSLAYLAEGVVDLLSDRLALPGRLYPVDPRAVLLAEQQHRRGIGAQPGGEAAARLGAGLFVIGSVTRVGTEIQLAASLNETMGSRRATAIVTIAGEAGLFGGLDDVARQLVAGLYTDAARRLDRTAALTTSSLPALRAYLDAEREFRLGRFDAAVAGFRMAIELDPSMTIAYYAAAVAAEWTGRVDLSAPMLDRAWQLRDRLPEPEQLLLSARRATTPAERLRLFRIALGAYPDLVEARYETADLLFHYGHWGIRSSEVRAAFEAALAFNPNLPEVRVHLARIAAAEGDEPALRAEIEAHERTSGDRGGEWGVEARALHAMTFGSASAVSAAIIEMLRLDEESIVRMGSRLARYGGRRESLERLFLTLESSVYAPETRAFARVMRASLLAAAGRPMDGLRLLDVGQSPFPRITVAGLGIVATTPGVSIPDHELASIRARLEEWAYRAAPALNVPSGYIGLLADTSVALFGATAGMLAAEAGDVHAADGWARSLDARGMRDAAAFVRAHIARDDPARRLEAIGRTSEKPYYDVTVRETWDRGRALLALGDTVEADRWFAAFTYEHPFNFVVLPAAWVERGRIAESSGRPADAARFFEHFLAARPNPEPAQRAVVDSVRARLAGLRNARRPAP